MTRQLMRFSWRLCAVSTVLVFALSSFASAKLQVSDQAAIGSYDTARIEEELQV